MIFIFGVHLQSELIFAVFLLNSKGDVVASFVFYQDEGVLELLSDEVVQIVWLASDWWTLADVGLDVVGVRQYIGIFGV